MVLLTNIQELKMNHHISVECPGLDKLSLSQISKFERSLFLAIERVNAFLVDSLEGNFEVTHKLDVNSPFNSPKINIALEDTDDLDADKIDAFYCYLAKAGHAIFTADYQGSQWDDVLMKLLTETAIEAEELILRQTKLFDTKILNRVALSKAIEKVTAIESVGKNGLGINLLFGNFECAITSLSRRKAEDLLGGKWLDKDPQTGDFVVSRIPFESIQKRSEFLLDGLPVTVFITDMKWIKNFNAGKVKLAKNDKIRAKFLIERSPVSKKPVAYYFTEVSGPDL